MVDDLKLIIIMIGKYHCVTVIVDYMNPFFHEYFEGKSTEKYYKGQTHFKNMFFKGKIPEKHSCDIKKRLSIIVFIVPFVEWLPTVCFYGKETSCVDRWLRRNQQLTRTVSWKIFFLSQRGTRQSILGSNVSPKKYELEWAWELEHNLLRMRWQPTYVLCRRSHTAWTHNSLCTGLSDVTFHTCLIYRWQDTTDSTVH